MIYQSGDFSLDTQSYGFERDGKNHPVEPQVFDLLIYLIENRNRVVTRDELLDKLWHDRIVSDSALNGRLKAARKAIGDNGKQQSFIKTIHRRGYQYIADVIVSPEYEKNTTAAASERPPLPAKPSIVVLPFELLSDGKESNYFADGLTKDIIANLCRYRELLVIDPNSAFAYRESKAGTLGFAHQLGVEYATKGEIRRSGGRVRISVHLIEVASGKIVWGANIERDFDDIFALEDEVAASIASTLVSHIEEESHFRASRKHPENLTAFDYVMRARQDVSSRSPEQIASARALLDQAAKLDPGYAAAYAYLAWSYVVESETEWCTSRDKTLEQAVVHARRAADLDVFDSTAHVALGWAYLSQKKFDLAEIHLDRAIDCNPNDYEAYCIKSWLLAMTGRAAEVAVCGTTALQLNPLVPDDCLMAIITARYTNGNYAAALETLERIKDPDAYSEALRAASLVQLGREGEARRAAARAVDLGGDFLQGKEWLAWWPFKNPLDLKHFLDGLYKSGVLKDLRLVTAKPSIAVLQFRNISEDPTQQYFSDGMTANICARISRISSLLVKSGSNFDGSKTPLSQISEELEVSYLLNGAVQKEDDHVRVYVELVDGRSGKITWSDNFDRRGTAVIEIQDDIARVITGTLWSHRGTILEAERDNLSRKPTEDFNAFDYILKGIYQKEKYTAEGLVEAHACFDKAISLDPDSAEAMAWNAWAHIVEILMGWSSDNTSSLSQAYAEAKGAIAIDLYSEMGHWALGAALLMDKDYDRGFAEYDKALEINPNNPDLMVTKGSELSICGRFDEGIELIQQGMNFNKHHPEWYFWHLGIAYFAANRFQHAIDAFNRMHSQNKDTRTYLAACYAQTGNVAEAQNQIAELFRIDSATSLDAIVEAHSYLSEETQHQLSSGLKLAMGMKARSE